jgi:hypothetical protein
MILNDPELTPIDAHVSDLGEPKGSVIEVLNQALKEAKEGEDVKLIWIVLPAAAAGFYLWTRKQGAAASLVPVAGSNGAAPPTVEPGTDAGTAPSLPITVPPTWSAGDLAALVNRIVTREGYHRPELVHAIIAVESGWNPNAVNKGDSAPRDQVDEGDSAGLMQLKVRTAQVFVPGVENLSQLLDPETNITAGVRFLAELERKWLSEYSIAGVIQMYNLGETAFRNGERNSGYLGRVQAKIQSYNLTR